MLNRPLHPGADARLILIESLGAQTGAATIGAGQR